MNKCSDCGRVVDGEMTWPGEQTGEICQECWESYCSREWWKAVNAINAGEVP